MVDDGPFRVAPAKAADIMTRVEAGALVIPVAARAAVGPDPGFHVATRVFRCLADATRVRLLWTLAERGELIQKQLIAGADRSQGAVARHLGALLACDLVAVRRSGRYSWWSPGPMAPVVVAFLRALERARRPDEASPEGNLLPHLTEPS